MTRCGFRDLDHERFRVLAENLLTAVVRKPVEAYYLDGFVRAATIVLMPLAPDHAAAITRELSDGHSRSTCLNGNGVAAAESAAWAAARAGNTRCAGFCREALRTAASDKQLMNLAITAQVEGAGSLLAFWCEEWLASPLAKERWSGGFTPALAAEWRRWISSGRVGSGRSERLVA